MMPELPKYACSVAQISTYECQTKAGGKWNDEESERMQSMKSWGVKILNLQNNQRPTLILEIEHIHFGNLIYLGMWKNNIQSVEGLVRVDMPHIQKLVFDRNNICSVRVLRKGNWPSLKTLFICDNYFRDARTLSQGFFPELEEMFSNSSAQLLLYTLFQENPYQSISST